MSDPRFRGQPGVDEYAQSLLQNQQPADQQSQAATGERAMQATEQASMQTQATQQANAGVNQALAFDPDEHKRKLATYAIQSNQIEQQRYAIEPDYTSRRSAFEDAKKAREKAEKESVEQIKGGFWMARNKETGVARSLAPTDATELRKAQDQAKARFENEEKQFKPLEEKWTAITAEKRRIAMEKLAAEEQALKHKAGLLSPTQQQQQRPPGGVVKAGDQANFSGDSSTWTPAQHRLWSAASEEQSRYNAGADQYGERRTVSPLTAQIIRMEMQKRAVQTRAELGDIDPQQAAQRVQTIEAKQAEITTRAKADATASLQAKIAGKAPGRSYASEFSDTLQKSGLYASATSAIGTGKFRELKRAQGGDWDLPLLTQVAEDSNIGDKIGAAVVAAGQKLGAGMDMAGRGIDKKAIQKVFHDFQQANNLSDEEMNATWQDFTKATKSWDKAEKARVFSNGKVEINPLSREFLDTETAKKRLAESGASEEAQAEYLAALPTRQINVASNKLEAYEAAAAAAEYMQYTPAGGSVRLTSGKLLSPSQYAQQTGRNAAELNTPEFIVEYEREVLDKQGKAGAFIRGLTVDGLLGWNKVATTGLGLAGLAGSETAAGVAQEASNISSTIGQGKSDTGLAGSVMQEAPSILTQIVASQLTGGASVLATSGRVAGTVNTVATLAMAGSQSAGMVYAAERAEGKTHEEAQKNALISGANTAIITGLFNKMGAGGVEAVAAGKKVSEVTMKDLLRSTTKQELWKNTREMAKALVKSTGGEATEEGLDEFTQQFLIAEPTDNLADAWKVAWESFRVGGVIGGAVAVGTTAAGEHSSQIRHAEMMNRIQRRVASPPDTDLVADAIAEIDPTEAPATAEEIAEARKLVNVDADTVKALDAKAKAYQEAIKAKDWKGAAAIDEEIQAMAGDAEASPVRDTADAVILYREITEQDKATEKAYNEAQAEFNVAMMSGDKDAKAQTGAELAAIRAERQTVLQTRAALKIASGKGIEALTEQEINAMGWVSDEKNPGQIIPMNPKQLADSGLSTKLMKRAVDGSFLLTDQVVETVRATNERAGRRVKLSEQDAAAMAEARFEAAHQQISQEGDPTQSGAPAPGNQAPMGTPAASGAAGAPSPAATGQPTASLPDGQSATPGGVAPAPFPQTAAQQAQAPSVGSGVSVSGQAAPGTQPAPNGAAGASSAPDASMDAGIYEAMRQQDASLPALPDRVAGAFAAGGPVSVSMQKASGIDVPEGYTRQGNVWTPPQQPGTGDAQAPQAANQVAENVKQAVEAKFPRIKGKVSVIQTFTDPATGQVTPTGGALVSTDGTVTLVLNDIARDIGATSDAQAVQDAVEAIVIDHEMTHVAQVEAVRSIWKSKGKPGTFNEFFTQWYGEMADQLAPEVMQAARSIYGEAAWDSRSKDQQAAEVVRMLVEAARPGADQGRFSELLRAVKFNNSPNLIQTIREALKKLMEMLSGGNLPDNVRQHIENIAAIYEEMSAGYVSDELADARKTATEVVTAAIESNPAIKGNDDLRIDLSNVVWDLADVMAGMPEEQRKPFVEAAIADWLEGKAEDLQAEQAKQEEAVGKPEADKRSKAKAARKAYEARIRDKAREIVNSGNYSALYSIYERGAITPKPRVIPLILARKKSGQRLSEKEMELLRNLSEWDGMPLKQDYPGGGNNAVIRAIIDILMAPQGKGLMPDVMADDLIPNVTTSSEMFEALYRELESISRGKQMIDEQSPDYKGDPEAIAEADAKRKAEQEAAAPTIDSTAEGIYDEFGPDSNIAEKAHILATHANRFEPETSKTMVQFLQAEAGRLRAGVIDPAKWLEGTQGWPTALRKFYVPLANMSPARLKAWADSLPVIEEEMGDNLFSSPAVKISSSSLTKRNKAIDAAYEAGNYDLAEQLDARLEEDLENMDSRMEGMDEADQSENEINDGVDNEDGLASDPYAQLLASRIAWESGRIDFDGSFGEYILSHGWFANEKLKEGTTAAQIEEAADELLASYKAKRGAAGAMFSSPSTPPPFYSQLARTLEAKMPKSAPPAQVIQIATSGAKAEEIKWSGIVQTAQDMARDNGGKVDKARLLDWLANEGAVRFEEVQPGLSGKYRFRGTDGTYQEFDTEEEALKAREGEVDWAETEGAGSYSINEDERDATFYNHEGDIIHRFTFDEDAEEWSMDKGHFQESSETWTTDQLETFLDEEKERLADEWKDMIGEVEFTGEGKNKYALYVLPGGENYREVVLAMPDADPQNVGPSATIIAKYQDQWDALVAEKESFAWNDFEPRMKVDEKLDALHDKMVKETVASMPGNYTSSHFPDVPNYVAHMRLNERTDADGKPGLFVEEIQSDRHQAGREKGYREQSNQSELPEGYVIRQAESGLHALYFQSHGYESMVGSFRDRKMAVQKANEDANSGKIADAPFRTTWPLALFKRALRDAVAGGKEWIGWTVGETQNDRFDLSKQVDKMVLFPDMTVRAYKDGAEIISQKTTAETLPDLIGKDAAQKLLDAPTVNEAPNENQEAEPHRKLEGADLKVGGSGMKGFYDNILPKEIGKYVKQWGGKVETATIPDPEALDTESLADFLERTGLSWEAGAKRYMQERQKVQVEETPIHRITITPEMRKGVQAGQALFSSPSNQGSLDFGATGSMGDKQQGGFIFDSLPAEGDKAKLHQNAQKALDNAKTEKAKEVIATDIAKREGIKDPKPFIQAAIGGQGSFDFGTTTGFNTKSGQMGFDFTGKPTTEPKETSSTLVDVKQPSPATPALVAEYLDTLQSLPEGALQLHYDGMILKEPLETKVQRILELERLHPDITEASLDLQSERVKARRAKQAEPQDTAKPAKPPQATPSDPPSVGTDPNAAMIEEAQKQYDANIKKTVEDLRAKLPDGVESIQQLRRMMPSYEAENALNYMLDNGILESVTNEQRTMDTSASVSYKWDAEPTAKESLTDETKQEPGRNINARHTVTLSSILTPAGAIKTSALRSGADSAVWHYQGDIGQLAFDVNATFEGKNYATDYQKKALAQVKAARADGWSAQTFKAGSYGSMKVFVKGDNVLTNAGADALVSGKFQAPDVMQDRGGAAGTIAQQAEFASRLVEWMATLPESTVNSASAFGAKVSTTKVTEWMLIERNKDDVALWMQDKSAPVKAGTGRGVVAIRGATLEDALNKAIAMAANKREGMDPNHHMAWYAWDKYAGVNEASSVNAALIAAGFKQAETAPETTGNEAAAEEMPPITNLRALAILDERLRNGTITAAQMKAAWEEYKTHEDAIRAETAKLTIKDLSRYSMRKPDNKEEAVRMAMSYYQSRFNPTGGLSPQVSLSASREEWKKAERKAMNEAVALWTDEKIQADAQERRNAIEARKKALENPETKDEWQQFVRKLGSTGPFEPGEKEAIQKIRDSYAFEAAVMKRGESKLTPDQLAAYDAIRGIDRKAEAQREAESKAMVRGVKADTDSEIIETKHTKTGADLFVVRLADRVERDVYNSLNTAAKRLGGYYSSYRGGGAVPGFQFKDRATAEQFQAITKGETVDRTEALAEKKEARKSATAEKLSALADRMDKSADGVLSADRKTNTAKRAREAGYAEANANSVKAMATTIRNLAAAIESGEATHLDGVAARTHVETLQSLSNRAKSDAENAENLSYSERENRKGEKPTPEQIDKAKYPYPFLNETAWQWLIENGKNTPGAMRLTARLEKVFAAKPSAQSNGSYITGEEIIGVVKDLLGKINKQDYTRKNIEGAFEHYDRLQTMGLKDLPSLRAALREFLQYRGTKAKADPVKAMERELVGMKIEGFFPTPPAVIERMTEEAGDLTGKRLLEPSAGKGDIVEAAQRAGATVDAIEQHYSLRNILEAKGANLIGRDFMDVEPVAEYDVVMMNPPFENGQDGEHVMRAFQFLKPGGKLVAITGEGTFFRSDAKARAFRDWLESVGGTDEKLPEGSFKSAFRPTGVNTRLVVIEKSTALLSSPTQPDLFTAANAPDAPAKLGSVKVGNMSALAAYKALTAKRDAGKTLTGKEEQQLLDAEKALGQKMAFDMESVKGEVPPITQSADARALAMMNRKGFTKEDDKIRKQIEARLRKAGADEDLIYDITVGKFLDTPQAEEPTKPKEPTLFAFGQKSTQQSMFLGPETSKDGQMSLLSSAAAAPGKYAARWPQNLYAYTYRTENSRGITRHIVNTYNETYGTKEDRVFDTYAEAKEEMDRLDDLGSPALLSSSSGSNERLDGDGKNNPINTNDPGGANISDAASPSSVVTPEMDAAYLDAVERGDLDTALEFVEKAAKNAGYTSGPYFHGTPDGRFNAFDPTVRRRNKVQGERNASAAFWFTDNENLAAKFAMGGGTLAFADPKFLSRNQTIKRVHLRLNNAETVDMLNTPLSSEERKWRFNDAIEIGFRKERVSKQAIKEGKTAVIFKNSLDGDTLRKGTTIGIFDVSEIAITDAVLRDSSGNVIPLSQRFNQPPPAESGGNLLSSPTPDFNPVKMALEKSPPIYADVYFALQEGKSIEETAKEFGISTKAVQNIIKQVQTRITVATKAAAGTLKPKMNEDGLYQGGRPDLAYGARPDMVAIDQIRNDQDIKPGFATRTMKQIREDADKALDADFEGQFTRLEKLMQAGEMPTGDDVAIAIRLFERASTDGNMSDPDRRARLALFQTQYRDQGTMQSEAFRMRQDEEMPPAARNAMHLTKLLYEPSPKVQARVKSAGKDKAAVDAIIKQWMDKIDKFNAEMKAKGYDIEQSLAEFRKRQEAIKEAEEVHTGTKAAMDQAFMKLSEQEKVVIRLIREGAKLSVVQRSTGLNKAQIMDIKSRFGQTWREAIIDAGKRFAERSLLSSAPRDVYEAVMTDLGWQSDDDFDDTAPDYLEKQDEKRREAKAQERKARKPAAPKPQGLTELQQAAVDAAFKRFQNAPPSTWTAWWQETAAKLTPMIGQASFEQFREQTMQPWRDLWQTEMDAITDPAGRMSFEEWINKPADQWTSKQQDLLDERLWTPEQKAAWEEKTKGTFHPADPAPLAHLANEWSRHNGTWINKIVEWFKMAILSGVQTILINASGGLHVGYMLTAQKPMEATWNSILGMFGAGDVRSATWSEILPMIKSVRAAAKLAASNAVRSWQLESPVFDSYAQAKPIQIEFSLVGGEYQAPALSSTTLKELWHDPTFRHGIGFVNRFMRNITFRQLTATDEFWKGMYSQLEVAAVAHRIAAKEEKLSGDAYAKRTEELMKPGSIAWLRIIKKTKRATFQDQLAYGKFTAEDEKKNPAHKEGTKMTWAQASKKGQTESAWTLLDALAAGAIDLRHTPFLGPLLHVLALPFIITPKNLIQRGLEVTPLGLFVDMIDGMRALRRRLYSGQLTKEEGKRIADELYNKARFIETLTNQSMGAMLYLVVEQLIDGDDDDDDKRPWITGTSPWSLQKRGEGEFEDAVMPPQSIRIGNTIIPYGRIEPFSTGLSFITDMANARHRNNGFNSTATTDLIVGMKEQFKDKLFLKGIGDILRVIEDPARAADRLTANHISAYLPNIIRQPIREMDKVKRDTNPLADDGFFQAVAKRVGYSLYPQGAPPKVDLWGKVIPSHRGGLIGGSEAINTMFRIVDPLNVTTGRKPDPLDAWVFRYNHTTPESADRIGLPAIDRTIVVTDPRTGEKVKVDLSPEEHLQANQRAGQAAKAMLEGDWNKAALTPENAERIVESVRKAQKEVRAEIRARKVAELLAK